MAYWYEFSRRALASIRSKTSHRRPVGLVSNGTKLVVNEPLLFKIMFFSAITGSATRFSLFTTLLIAIIAKKRTSLGLASFASLNISTFLIILLHAYRNRGCFYVTGCVKNWIFFLIERHPRRRSSQMIATLPRDLLLIGNRRARRAKIFSSVLRFVQWHGIWHS